MMRAPASIRHQLWGIRSPAPRLSVDELGCVFRVSWAWTSALPRMSGSGRRSPRVLRFGRAGATSCLVRRMHYQFQTRPLIPFEFLRPE